MPFENIPHKLRLYNQGEKRETHDEPEVVKPGRQLPPTPTSAQPGSEAKIQVMRERFFGGYHIHHPHDATINWSS